MKTTSKFIAMAFVLMMALMPFIAAEESSAADQKIDSYSVTKSFDDMSGGTIEVKITGCTVDEKYIVKATETEKEDSHAYTSSEFTATASEMKVSLSWNFGSSGHKTFFIQLYDENGVRLDRDGGHGIEVSHSIWKDWTTYLAIVIVVILVIVAVYLKMRGLPGSPKTKKNKKAFTEMEAQRRESEKSGEKKMFFSKNKEQIPAAPPAEPKQEQPAAPDMTSTEKQTYSPGRGFFKKRNQ